MTDHTDHKSAADADNLLNLLIESQSSIGGDWRERRDAAVSAAVASKSAQPVAGESIDTPEFHELLDALLLSWLELDKLQGFCNSKKKMDADQAALIAHIDAWHRARPAPAPAVGDEDVLSPEQIVARFEAAISQDPSAYTKVGQTVYQVTQAEVIAYTQALTAPNAGENDLQAAILALRPTDSMGMHSDVYRLGFGDAVRAAAALVSASAMPSAPVAPTQPALQAGERDAVLINWLEGDAFVALNAYIAVYDEHGQPLEKERKHYLIERESTNGTFKAPTVREAIAAAMSTQPTDGAKECAKANFKAKQAAKLAPTTSQQNKEPGP